MRAKNNDIEICEQVLREVIHILQQFKDSIVIVGGWVPYLCDLSAKSKHLGSFDVDIAIDGSRIKSHIKATIIDILKKNGYSQDKEYSFRFWKYMHDEHGKHIPINIDFLTGAEAEDGILLEVSGIKAVTNAGCNLAFLDNRQILLHFGSEIMQVKIANAVPFLTMKGMAIADTDKRAKSKDYYDIYYFLKHCSTNLNELAKEFEKYSQHALVMKSVSAIKQFFQAADDRGPKLAARFMGQSGLEAEITAQDAFHIVTDFLQNVEQVLKRSI